jgi:hypothetical protein
MDALLPECLDGFIDESNPVRVIEVFVDALDLAEMSFEGVEPATTGRPSYHPSVLLKRYIYGYLNRVLSSRRHSRGVLPWAPCSLSGAKAASLRRVSMRFKFWSQICFRLNSLWRWISRLGARS